jgi:3',5'-cyclic AMP phosphodiesterase CpdA
MSDPHVATSRFRADLLRAAVAEANEPAPDLVVIAGDLTREGYRGEFEHCRRFLDELTCPGFVVTMGNHDARNNDRVQPSRRKRRRVATLCNSTDCRDCFPDALFFPGAGS